MKYAPLCYAFHGAGFSTSSSVVQHSESKIYNLKLLYLAITGDIIRSRDYPESELKAVQTKLDEFNRKHQPLVPFAIQAGDEIQGLISLEAKPLLLIIDMLAELYPLKIRWGIGRGSIDTQLRKSTADMRGQAFEYSRKALQSANKHKKLMTVSGDLTNLTALNLILALIGGYLAAWDARAFRRYQLFVSKRSAQAVATVEGVSVSAVNKHLNRRHIRLVIEGMEYFDRFIRLRPDPDNFVGRASA